MCTINSSANPEQRMHQTHTETRQATRHCLKKGFIAFGSENFCEIVNISQTGIAIEYMAHKNDEVMDMSEIHLINNLEGYLLGQLSCATVYTSDTPLSPTDNFTVLRRMGMQFISMDENQQSQLSNLLDNYSTGEYSVH